MTNYAEKTGTQLEDLLVSALIDSIDDRNKDEEIAQLQREYGWRLGAIDCARGTKSDQTDWSPAILEGYASGRIECAAAIAAARNGR